MSDTSIAVRKDASFFVPYRPIMEKYVREMAQCLFRTPEKPVDLVFEPEHVREKGDPGHKWLPVFSKVMDVDRWNRGVPRVRIGLRSLCRFVCRIPDLQGIVIDPFGDGVQIPADMAAPIADGEAAFFDVDPVELDLSAPLPVSPPPVLDPPGASELMRQGLQVGADGEVNMHWEAWAKYVASGGCILIGFASVLDARDVSRAAQNWLRGRNALQRIECGIGLELLPSVTGDDQMLLVGFTNAEMAVRSREVSHKASPGTFASIASVSLGDVIDNVLCGNCNAQGIVLDPAPYGSSVRMDAPVLAALRDAARKIGQQP